MTLYKGPVAKGHHAVRKPQPALWGESIHVEEPLDTRDVSEALLDFQDQCGYQLTATDLMSLLLQESYAAPNPDPKYSWEDTVVTAYNAFAKVGCVTVDNFQSYNSRFLWANFQFT